VTLQDNVAGQIIPKLKFPKILNSHIKTLNYADNSEVPSSICPIVCQREYSKTLLANFCEILVKEAVHVMFNNQQDCRYKLEYTT